MNLPAIRAIYKFEMARTGRTLLQSIVSPVISTSLYFVVFGAAIGSRITEIEGVPYGAFIVPGLIMLMLLKAQGVQRVELVGGPDRQQGHVAAPRADRAHLAAGRRLVRRVDRQPIDVGEIGCVDGVGPAQMFIVAVQHDWRTRKHSTRHVPTFAGL